MLAVDLGGTRLKAGQVHDGVVTDLVAVTHGSTTLAGALLCLEPMLGDGPVAVCLPGLISDDGEIVGLPGKLDGAVGFDLVGWLRERIGGTPTVVNDAIAYGVGEALPGRTVVMTIGTGIGVAVIEDGRPLGRGPVGAGKLSGQLWISGDGPAGTIESWCRADRILAEVQAAGGKADDVPGALAAAAAGDAAAAAGLSSYRVRLAKAVGALCLAHGPDAVVIGGGPAQDPVLLVGLQELVDPYLWPGQQVEVRAAQHGDAAALIGLERLHRGL